MRELLRTAIKYRSQYDFTMNSFGITRLLSSGCLGFLRIPKKYLELLRILIILRNSYEFLEISMND